MQYLTDENISRRFISALRRRFPDIDIVRVQDVGLQSKSDEIIIDWAVQNKRTLITQDRATIPPLVELFLKSDKPTSRIMIIRPQSSFTDILQSIENIELYGLEQDWVYPIRWIP